MHEFYMDQALKAAQEGIDQGEFPFGCCLADDTGFYLTSHNETNSKKNPLQHAEIIALNAMCEKIGKEGLQKCTIYATTMPCIMCFGAIHWAGIRNIYFGTDIEKSIICGFSDIVFPINDILADEECNISISGGILKERCNELFDVWSKKNRVLKWAMKKQGK